ncbi:MAG TPA: hypothetical protein DCY07_01435 [Rhodospirillaceae bacterium]|nr:hypothetical protein [Rhodospirillaceae bacterium]
MEGWEAWDVALKCAGQLRTAQFAIVGIDMNAALKIAEMFGYDTIAHTELLFSFEKGMVSSVNEALAQKEHQ